MRCLRAGECLAQDDNHGYFKLVRASHLDGAGDDAAAPGRRGAVVVAFASSQGTPEWAGVLSKTYRRLRQRHAASAIARSDTGRWLLEEPAESGDEMIFECWQHWGRPGPPHLRVRKGQLRLRQGPREGHRAVHPRLRVPGRWRTSLIAAGEGPCCAFP